MNVDRDKPVNGDFEKRIKYLLEYYSTEKATVAEIEDKELKETSKDSIFLFS